MVYIWFVHGPLLGELHDRIQHALSRPEGMEKTRTRARALNGIGFMYWADMVPTDKRTELEEAVSGIFLRHRKLGREEGTDQDGFACPHRQGENIAWII